MLPRYFTILVFFSLIFGPDALGQQQKGQFSGSFDTNLNFFLEDKKIGATGTPQYDANPFDPFFNLNWIGIESWLNLRYQKGTFDVGLRLDYFNNSNLRNPSEAYSDYGLGKIYVTKRWDYFDITAGYFYDQIGSGVIFKAYEERALLIDNAVLGLRVRADITDTWNVMAFGGRQRNLFDIYDAWLYGAKAEGYISPASAQGKWSLAPGIGLIFKSLQDKQMDLLADVLATYTPEDFIEEVPFTNFAVSVYNTLQAGAFSWYVEGAYKSKEAFYDLFAARALWNGGESEGRFVLDPGYVIYNSFNYAAKGLGASLELKATSNFNFRADPFATLNRGLIHFLPPMTRVNTYRLTSRYNAATQDLGELAGQLEVSYRASAKKNYLVNFAHITDQHGNLLYREVLGEATFKTPRKYTLITGLQFQWYDQELYQGKTGADLVRAVTPYADFLYKLGKKQSIRIEAQYMHTKQDFGSWVFGLVELGIAPHWIFELSDMWNVVPYEDDTGHRKNDPLHFPTVGVTFSTGSHRFNARWVKQVEGVVCSGGICRLEPAFSGVRFTVSSQF